MAVREIKTRLSVDGEQAFKRAITDANTSLKNMGTQLTLAAAQFKKDGDAMKFMESRSKTLKAEIGQQQQIVKALEKALEDSTKAYGANSTKTEKWEAELNRSKAKLIGLQTELNNNENGLDKSGRAFEDATDKAADFQATVSNIGKNVSFATVTGGLDKITSGLENVLKKAINVGVTIKDLFVDAGQWADELTTDATRYGMDTETLQRWQYAAKMVDTPVENIITARDKLTKKMNSGWKDGKRDMWEVLGIDLTDAETGRARDKMDILWDAGQTLLNVAEMQEQGKTNLDAEALSMELFGKSWRDMLPLFKAGRKEFEAYAAAAPIVADKNVTALTGMNDSLETTETNWEALKNTFLAELAPTMTKVSDSLSGLLENLLEWIESDDGQAAIQGLAEALESLFSGLSDIKFEDALEKAKGALDALKDALVWVKNNGSNIANALKYIGIGLGAIKLTNAGLKVLQLISGFTGLLGGGGAGAGIGSTIATGIGAGLLKASPWLAGLAVFTKNAWTPQGNDDIWDASGNPTELGKSMGITWKQSEDIQHYGEHQLLMAHNYSYPTNSANVGTSGIISPHGRGKFNLTQEQRDLAETYWDLYRNGTTGDAFERAYDALEASFGPDGETFERLMGYIDGLLETMNENEHTANWNPLDYVNLPTSFFRGGSVNTRQQNQINDALAQMMFESGAGPVSGRWAALMGGDLKEFNRLPGQMQDKVQIGVQRGISGLRVTIDGQVAGRILAPYVSQEIARGAQ